MAFFIEDLNFWLDKKIFLYQKNKTDREAERFMRQLSDGVSGELAGIINDRSLDCRNCKTKKKSHSSKGTVVAVRAPAFLKIPVKGNSVRGFSTHCKREPVKDER